MTNSRDHKLIPIDLDKLQAIVYRQGKTMADISRELGFSDGYFSKLRHRGYSIKRATVLMLKTAYGIEYDDIKPDEPQEPDEPQKPAEPEPARASAQPEPVPAIDYDRLGAAIRDAVKNGLLDVITHKAEYDLISTLIKNAVKRGMRENIEEMRGTK